MAGLRTAPIIAAALGVAAAVLTAPAATADPALPDFSAFPKADAKDYVVRDGVAYSVRGFTTPEGVFCTSSSHRGMSSVDCFSTVPLPGASDGANTVHVRRSGNVLEPTTMVAAQVEPGPGPVEFEGHPLRMLPPAVDYAFDQANCARDATTQLACVMSNGTEQHGFVIRDGHTEVF
ncbi:hypothetical protein ABQE69_16070 [Mycolicibacillus trivialis]|uniref:Secreted protein n=1 Tax=Mycolicibacillus trivialis TaxID=1798 RepID=A0A1X2EQD6_9MYCO|nr:hypothetical protein [Mycolicibacillus trivialis]ORX08411.1 hypothetical protein AWC30_01900 [Mycolicibacillus trivialis]